MRIISLVENTSKTDFLTEHGLSLLIIRDNGEKILFDMGQRALFAENAKRLGFNILDIDYAVISHGHYDHGGGLRTFLNLNFKAKVFVRQEAFQPHFSLRDTGLRYIGLDTELSDNQRLVFTNRIEKLSEQMILFSDVEKTCCNPLGNRLLFGPYENQNDDFCHEQSLIILEGDKTVLFAGCAHSGIVNITRRASEICGVAPTHVFAGMHLTKSGLSPQDETTFIEQLSEELLSFKNCKFYTMHCTGENQFKILETKMRERIEYFGCGEEINLNN